MNENILPRDMHHMTQIYIYIYIERNSALHTEHNRYKTNAVSIFIAAIFGNYFME